MEEREREQQQNQEQNQQNTTNTGSDSIIDRIAAEAGISISNEEVSVQSSEMLRGTGKAQ